jgi:hypothetical protein
MTPRLAILPNESILTVGREPRLHESRQPSGMGNGVTAPGRGTRCARRSPQTVVRWFAGGSPGQHGQDAHATRTPAGVTANAGPGAPNKAYRTFRQPRAAGLLCETNPIPAGAANGASPLWERGYRESGPQEGSPKQSQSRGAWVAGSRPVRQYAGKRALRRAIACPPLEKETVRGTHPAVTNGAANAPNEPNRPGTGSDWNPLGKRSYEDTGGLGARQKQSLPRGAVVAGADPPGPAPHRYRAPAWHLYAGVPLRV